MTHMLKVNNILLDEREKGIVLEALREHMIGRMADADRFSPEYWKVCDMCETARYLIELLGGDA